MKEAIKETVSIYQYVNQGRTYPVDYGLQKVISRQIVEIDSGDVVAEFTQYKNSKHLGWFFSGYYSSGKSCELDSLSGQIIISLRNLIVNGIKF